MVGFEGNGLIVISNGIIKPIELFAGIATLELGIGIIGHQFDRPGEIFDRLF